VPPERLKLCVRLRTHRRRTAIVGAVVRASLVAIPVPYRVTYLASGLLKGCASVRQVKCSISEVTQRTGASADRLAIGSPPLSSGIRRCRRGAAKNDASLPVGNRGLDGEFRSSL
jgi:hypothetical protein